MEDNRAAVELVATELAREGELSPGRALALLGSLKLRRRDAPPGGQAQPASGTGAR